LESSKDLSNRFRMIPRQLLCILLIYLPSQQIKAQVFEDSTFAQRVSKVIDVYYRALGEESPLYNGSEYIEYAFTIQEGHPFFESPVWAPGDIQFEGMTFHDVPMLYDIIKDLVIIQDFHKQNKINLAADKIQEFTLSGHTFVHVVHDASNEVRTGFYDRLYNGKIELLAKREKKILEKMANLQISNVVIGENIYYVRKNGVYYLVKNKRTFLDVLKNKKKEVQQYLKKNKIRFKDNFEKAMTVAVTYYDQLN